MKPFRERYRAALSDHNVRDGLLGFQRSWRETRDERVAELEELTGASFETLRSDLASVKDGVIADLDGHVARFRAAAEANGAVVYEAASAEEANRYIADLCRERGVDAVVKGKSMVSEEIELNDFLAAEGVAAVESDLGEWILQLEHDHPSHLVMPAIHRRRDQVAETLGRALGTSFDPDDIPGMVHSARGGLREAFLRAGVGLTGANALIAESGTAMVITNEGNGRLTASLPPVHVVTAGIEKIVPSFQDAIRQVRLLPRSATGQSITSYTTFVSGPTEGHELHIVLLDNGRRAMASDPQFASALRCVRCGACANVCPPYQIVGGHGFGHIYPGAIGLVTTPFHHGLEAAAGPQSLCVSCGACATVCPVAIPLPQQILGVRRRVAEEQGLPLWQRAALRAWRSRRAAAVGFRTIGLLSMPLRRGSVIRVPRRLPWSTRWIGWRTPPAISTQPAHARMAPHAQRRPLAETRATGRRVLLHLQCLADRVTPETSVAAAALLRAAGAEVVIPPRQHCCGLPAFDAGDHDAARQMARDTLRAFDGADDVVTPAPSCVVAILHGYQELFADEPEWAERAARLTARVHDLVSYLAGPARLPAGTLAQGDAAPVVVHRFCQGANFLGAGAQLEDLVTDLCEVEVRPLAEADTCCGFGGMTSLGHPELSAGILERKLSALDDAGVRTVLTANPGCVIHLRGGVDASGRELDVQHVAEYLAARLPR